MNNQKLCSALLAASLVLSLVSVPALAAPVEAVPAGVVDPVYEARPTPEVLPMAVEAEPERLWGDLPIDWSRTAEDDVLIEGGFKYGSNNTSHIPSSDALERIYGGGELSELVADGSDTPVWDANTDAAYFGGYTKNSGVKHPGATWRNHSGVSLRRIQGTFTIPETCSVLDSTIRLVSASQPSYEADGKLSKVNGGKVVAVNDNIYVFVYKQGEEITAENCMDFFAFYGGHDIPNQFGGLTNVMGKRNTAYQKLMAVSDSWFILSQIDNLGAPLANVYGPNAMASETYVIDMFLEDNSRNNGGGMDEVVLEFALADPKTAPVIVEYYRDGVSEENLLGRETYKGQIIGESWNTGRVDLNRYRSQAGEGYKAGQIVSGIPFTVSEDAGRNVVRVVYPEPDRVRLTVEHIYTSGYVCGSDLGGTITQTTAVTRTFAAPNESVSVDMLTDGPDGLSYEFVELDGGALSPAADPEHGTVSVQLTDEKEQALRIFYFRALTVPYEVEHRYYTSVDGGDYGMDAALPGASGSLTVGGTIQKADLAQNSYDGNDYTLDLADGNAFVMGAAEAEAYAADQTAVPTITLSYYRDVKTTEPPVVEPTEPPVVEPTEPPVVEPTEPPKVEPTEPRVAPDGEHDNDDDYDPRSPPPQQGPPAGGAGGIAPRP